MRVLTVLAALIVAGFIATSAQAGEKVTICHATGSDSNPYVEVEVSVKSIESGHNPHAVHVGDYTGECEVLTSSQEATPTPTREAQHEEPGYPFTPTPTPTTVPSVTPVASSTSQAPEPSVPLSLPRSGGRP